MVVPKGNGAAMGRASVSANATGASGDSSIRAVRSISPDRLVVLHHDAAKGDLAAIDEKSATQSEIAGQCA